MNTQNTPVHIKLWHRDFWLMAISSLLLTMSIYILIPILPRWMMDEQHFSPVEVGRSMGVFGLGLYLMGALCSWLVQRYRRNVVCMWSMVALIVNIALLWYIDAMHKELVVFSIIMLHRFLLGATFGLAQMVLSSTLIIDTCESFQRTEANHSASWFARFALSLGPLAGLIVYALAGFRSVVLGAVGCAVCALLLVKVVTFPFRTPEEGVKVVSLDRFFLTHGFVLFINLLLVTTVIGLLFSMPFEPLFYALMMGGFLLALLAQRFVFRDAELKSEIITGLFLLVAALLILLVAPASPVSPVFVGLSAGIIGSRFLLFFIKLSRHCQRGTSQSTYFLGWETGLAIGLALGYGCFYQQPTLLIDTALALSGVALLLYHFFTHQWFLRNKNR
ncbi:MAG: MFS transporter [Prevotella sp.]|nr:MFS transporter [Prevotella sp.]